MAANTSTFMTKEISEALKRLRTAKDGLDKKYDECLKRNSRLCVDGGPVAFVAKRLNQAAEILEKATEARWEV